MKDEYKAPTISEISISTENIMVVSGNHEGYTDGELDIFGNDDFDVIIDIEKIGTLF